MQIENIAEIEYEKPEIEDLNENIDSMDGASTVGACLGNALQISCHHTGTEC